MPRSSAVAALMSIVEGVVTGASERELVRRVGAGLVECLAPGSAPPPRRPRAKVKAPAGLAEGGPPPAGSRRPRTARAAGDVVGHTTATVDGREVRVDVVEMRPGRK